MELLPLPSDCRFHETTLALALVFISLSRAMKLSTLDRP